MFNKSRKAVALGVAATLALTSGVAIAGDIPGTTLNDAEVVGSVKPSKLDKKKFKPVNLFLGVVNSPDSTGNPDGNAAAEMISISKNVNVDLSKAPVCTEPLPNGTTSEAARNICPDGSFLGEGVATVHAPGAAQACIDQGSGGQPCKVADQIVSVFNGPGPGQLRLHTYGDLGVASPTVNGSIVDSPENGYRDALHVPAAPNTGALKITSFNATIDRDTKVAKAICPRSKKTKFLREVTYKDGTSETASLTKPCKRV